VQASTISFMSDFGRADEFVGVVHGVIATIAPEVRVIDLTHDIDQGDVTAGALSLMRSIQYLPPGVVLAVVDPGVGTSRRAIAAETPWGHFVGPDNGLLSPAVALMGGAGRIVSIENPDVMLPSQGATFHGRDVFAPAAAVLASGQAKLEELGPLVDPGEVTPLLLPLCEVESDRITGQVWWVDRFGNCQTNVGPDDLAAVGLTPGTDLRVRIGTIDHTLPWVLTYGEVEPGQALIHVDSSGLVALALRDGNAAEELGLAPQSAVTFTAATGVGRRVPLRRSQ
jgi:S-adenosylmethionine hydrolase